MNGHEGQPGARNTGHNVFFYVDSPFSNGSKYIANGRSYTQVVVDGLAGEDVGTIRRIRRCLCYASRDGFKVNLPFGIVSEKREPREQFEAEFQSRPLIRPCFTSLCRSPLPGKNEVLQRVILSRDGITPDDVKDPQYSAYLLPANKDTNFDRYLEDVNEVEDFPQVEGLPATLGVDALSHEELVRRTEDAINLNRDSDTWDKQEETYRMNLGKLESRIRTSDR